MSINQTQKFKHLNVDPSALGMFGLALTTLVSSTEKCGFTSGTSLIIPWAFFFGAGAQLFACFEDNKRGNLFGATAFGAFALFWFSMGTTWLLQYGAFGETLKAAADPKQLGFVFVSFLIFALYMMVAALKTNKVLFIIFCLVNMLFFSQACTSFNILPSVSHGMAAAAEFGIAVMSFYGSGTLLINHQFGRSVLPMGKAIL